VFAVLQLDRFVSQQAQTPAGVSRGRGRTGQRGDLGALRAINLDGTSATRLVKQGGVESAAQVPPLDVEDGLLRDLEGGGNLFRMLAATQEVKDAGPGLRSGRRFAACANGCQRAEFGFA